jgi:hypothetical protein
VRVAKIRPSFVEFIPDELEEGVLYVSVRYKTCSHKCCCGCGEEVVTPLSPAEWKLTRQGDMVSLWPSIGNWDYACRSHYVIEHNQVRWAASMSARQIASVQRRDAADLERMVSLSNAAKGTADPVTRNKTSQPADWWQRLLRWLFGGGDT